MQPNRRQFIVASGVALAGTGAISGTAAAETSDAPAPDDPDRYDYPVTAEDSDTPVATVYGGFDCPYTADMVAESFDDILEEFVEPGRLTLRFRALEYDENGDPYISGDGVICGQAAGGVWQEDPDSFWDFFAAVYDEMPGDMSESKIERIMEDAGVDNAEYIADNLEDWDPDLRETADDAYSQGVEWTPTIELKGDLGNREDVVEWIEARLDDDGGQQESEESEESEESQESEEDADQDDTEGDQETGEEEPEESDDDSDAEDAEQADAGSDDGSDDGEEPTEDEQSGSGDDDSGSSDEESSSTDEQSGSGESSTDDGGSDDSDEDSGSEDSGGTGGGGGSFSCGDGNQASHASHGDSSGSRQSFVFPEASGSRRFL